jgi:hypothetical protein
MSNTSRRAILAGLSVATVALAPAVIAAPSAGSQELHALWNKRRALRPVYLESQARIAAAEAALPWWARSGPSRLYSDGTISGEISGWPAIRDMQPPKIEGALKFLRPSKADLRADYDALRSFHGDSPARRASYRDALRKLAIRKREQRAEEEKVELPALEKQHDAILDEMFAVASAIEALPDRSADAVAASLLIGFNLEANTRDNTGCNIQGIEGALRIMLPSLTGNIAADAADLLDNPDTPITERAAWIG